MFLRKLLRVRLRRNLMCCWWLRRRCLVRRSWFELLVGEGVNYFSDLIRLMYCCMVLFCEVFLSLFYVFYLVWLIMLVKFGCLLLMLLLLFCLYSV